MLLRAGALQVATEAYAREEEYEYSICGRVDRADVLCLHVF